MHANDQGRYENLIDTKKVNKRRKIDAHYF